MNDGDNWPFIVPLIILGEPGYWLAGALVICKESTGSVKLKANSAIMCAIFCRTLCFAAVFIVIVNAGCLWWSARNNRALEGEI